MPESTQEERTADSGGPGDQEPPFWPIEPPRLDSTELEGFVCDWLADAVFTSAHLPSYGKGGPDFSQEFGATWPLWGLLLESYGMPPDTYMQSVGVFYSYVESAQGFNPRIRPENFEKGAPTFIQTPKVLHREDWLAVQAEINRLETIQEDSLAGGGPPEGMSMDAYKAIHLSCHALYAAGRWLGGPNALAKLTPQLVTDNLSEEILRTHGSPEGVEEVDRWVRAEGLRLKRLQGEVGPYVRPRREIVKLLEHIEADKRLSYEPALVQINAPLALIQCEMSARVEVLKWVLGHYECGGGSAGDPDELD